MDGGQYDVLILGGGNAGMGVTVPTRKAGLSVALVEDRELGGTCPNRGCTPKKILVAAGHALDEIERASALCISVAKPRLDWTRLIDREKDMIRHLPASFAKLMAERGVEVLRERAAFAAPNAVRVGGRTIEAGHIVIATGSKPRKLSIPGAEHMITSDDVLSERKQPREVVFVGGGVIAFEFAHLYARAGSKVTILELLPRFLPALDDDAVEQLVRESRRIGITLLTGVKINRIEAGGERLRIAFDHDGSERAIEADRVVNGAGRVADVEALNLEAGNVRLQEGRIALDEYLRSASNPSVHVCGDALWSSPQLSPVATYEGRIVGRNIVEGPVAKPDYSAIPSCVFTVPALASIGLTETKAKQSGRKFKVETNDMRDWLSARAYNESAAWAKVIIDAESDRILGAHLFGHAGEELIHIFAFAMRFGISANDVRETMYAFPTFSNDIKSLL
ncbi:MAG: NAD(P)/FAD-dependent oxidoreductase [Xanthobacteraceae bacterium]